MSTFCDLKNRIKESLNVDYHTRDTLQKVNFKNPDNTYLGTFKGTVETQKPSMSDVSITGGNIKDVTLENVTIKSSDQTTLNISDISENLGELQYSFTNLTQQVDDIDTLVQKSLNVVKVITDDDLREYNEPISLNKILHDFESPKTGNVYAFNLDEGKQFSFSNDEIITLGKNDFIILNLPSNFVKSDTITKNDILIINSIDKDELDKIAVLESLDTDKLKDFNNTISDIYDKIADNKDVIDNCLKLSKNVIDISSFTKDQPLDIKLIFPNTEDFYNGQVFSIKSDGGREFFCGTENDKFVLDNRDILIIRTEQPFEPLKKDDLTIDNILIIDSVNTDNFSKSDAEVLQNEIDANISDLNDNISEISGRITDLETSLEDVDNTLDTVNESIETLSSLVGEHTNNITALSNKCKSASQDTEGFVKTTNYITGDEAVVPTSKAVLEQINTSVASVTDKFDDYYKKSDTLSKTEINTRIEQVESVFSNQLENVQTQITSINSDLNAVSERIDKKASKGEYGNVIFCNQLSAVTPNPEFLKVADAYQIKTYIDSKVDEARYESIVYSGHITINQIFASWKKLFLDQLGSLHISDNPPTIKNGSMFSIKLNDTLTKTNRYIEIEGVKVGNGDFIIFHAHDNNHHTVNKKEISQIEVYDIHVIESNIDREIVYQDEFNALKEEFRKLKQAFADYKTELEVIKEDDIDEENENLSIDGMDKFFTESIKLADGIAKDI